MELADVFSFFLVVAFCVLSSRCEEPAPEDEWDEAKFKEEASQTFNLIFHKYNRQVRPPQSYVEIDVKVSLQHIRHLDVHNQELQTILEVEMDWVDSRLAWVPNKVSQINANISQVWCPDIVILNNVAPTKDLYPSVIYVEYTGLVSWYRKQVVTTLCLTEPRSTNQSCLIDLGFMSNDRVDTASHFFTNTSSVTITDTFVNHDWHLLDVELQMDVETNTTERPDTMSIVLHLEEKPQALHADNKGYTVVDDGSRRNARFSCSHGNCGGGSSGGRRGYGGGRRGGGSGGGDGKNGAMSTAIFSLGGLPVIVSGWGGVTLMALISGIVVGMLETPVKVCRVLS